MTLQTVLAWSVGRSLCVTTIALPLSLLVFRIVVARRSTSTAGRLLTLIAVAPLFVPDLLTGFCYRMTAAKLVHSVPATEFLYGLLLVARVIALQLVIHMMLPASSHSAESLHSWKLLKRPDLRWWSTWLKMQIMGPKRAAVIGWLSGALLCFQEFETAALLQIDRHPIAYTVWLFDAHAVGEPISRSLSFVWPALLLQCLLLTPILCLLSVGRERTTSEIATYPSERPGRRLAGLSIIAISFGMIIVWPVFSNLKSVFVGFEGLLSQSTFTSRCTQILHSTTAAGTAAVLALLIATKLHSLQHRWLTWLSVIPGLCGSLVLSLLLLRLFQWPLLNSIYDSWLPMIIATTLLMLPRAFAMVFLLQVTAPRLSVHSARLLTTSPSRKNATVGKRLLWHLVRKRWLLAAAVLTHWSFWDVTIASILRPVRFEPIVTRLYNEMHYGRTESLIAITTLSLLLPLLFFALCAFAVKLMPERSISNHD